MKRVRGNGGARSLLQPEGIIILGDYRSHRIFARNLGLPVPQDGEFVSARICPSGRRDPRNIPKVSLGGPELWRVAGPGDAVVKAPTLPFA
jgi:hypothetical protein